MDCRILARSIIGVNAVCDLTYVCESMKICGRILAIKVKERNITLKTARMTILTFSIVLMAMLAAACSDSTPAPSPTPDVSAIIQQAMSAQPQGATADEVAQAVQQAMEAQPGVTEEQMASAISRAMSDQPGVTEEQMAATISKAMAERPGVTEAQVANAIANALEAQTPGLTEAQVGDAIANALADRPGVTEDQVASAIAQALTEQTPGLTEAEVSEAIAKALSDRPSVTSEDIQKAVEEAVSMAAMAAPSAAMDGSDSMMMDQPDLLVRDVFFFATLTPPRGCSFWGCRVSFNMFDGLVAIDNTSAAKNVVPNLAESWEISEDGKSYTFNIRPDVTFTTGRPLTADAVHKSFERTFDIFEREGIAESQPWYTLTESMEAIDDSTFQWNLPDS